MRRPGIIQCGRRGNEELTYTPIPSPPSFSDTQTLIQSTTSQDIRANDCNGKSDLLVGSDYDFLLFTDLTGKRVKSLVETSPATWAELGAVGSGMSLRSTRSINFEFYNLRMNRQGAGIGWATSASPQTTLIQNVITENNGFAGVQVNLKNTGEDYGNFTIKFARVLSALTGEGFYLGNTGQFLGIVRSMFNNTVVENCYVQDTGRELYQFNGHYNLQATNLTGINGGLTNENVQNNGLQLFNCHGYIKKSIFYNTPQPLVLSTHGFLFEDCFFYFTNNARSTFVAMAAAFQTETLNHQPVIFRRCTFYNPNYTLTSFLDVREDGCDITFEDCVFPATAVNVFSDGRVDKLTYDLTHTGSTFTNIPPLPVFGDSPDVLYSGFEKVVTNPYYYNRKMGYRTPNT